MCVSYKCLKIKPCIINLYLFIFSPKLQLVISFPLKVKSYLYLLVLESLFQYLIFHLESCLLPAE